MPDTPLPRLEDLPGFWLDLAHRRCLERVGHCLEEAGLPEVSPRFIGVLLVLNEEDGLNMSVLSRRLGVEPSSMTGTIQRMSRARLVSRRADPRNRRLLRVYLRPQGRAVRPAVARALAQMHTEALAHFPDEDIRALVRVLRGFVAHCERLSGKDSSHSAEASS